MTEQIKSNGGSSKGDLEYYSPLSFTLRPFCTFGVLFHPHFVLVKFFLSQYLAISISHSIFDIGQYFYLPLNNPGSAAGYILKTKKI